MADNITLNAGTGGDTLAADEVSLSGVTVKVPRNKLGYGNDGEYTEVSQDRPLPVNRGYRNTSAAIAENATTSAAVDKRGFPLVRLRMPAAFTGTTLTFSASDDGVTYAMLYDRNNVIVSLPVTVNRAYELPEELAGCGFFKVVSDQTETNQRTLYFGMEG